VVSQEKEDGEGEKHQALHARFVEIKSKIVNTSRIEGERNTAELL
jgi:hypothetical protein